MQLISVTDRHMKGLRKTEECQATWDGSRKVVAYKSHVLLRIAMVIETFPVVLLCSLRGTIWHKGAKRDQQLGKDTTAGTLE